MGLGVLAGVGALVDYWPVSGDAPAVSAKLNVPTAPGPHPALDLDIPVSIATPAPAPVEFVVAALEPELAPAPLPELPALPVVVAAAALPGSRIVGLAAPTPTLEVIVAQMAPAPALPMPEFVAVANRPTPPRVVVPGFDAAQADDDGFLSDALGAFKTTGSTIARGGAKTGASIVDASVGAFRAVAGAFKRLKFF